MVVRKIFLLTVFIVFSFNALANTPRSTGKYKNWESFVAETDKGKICFAQTIPTKRAPSAIKRDKSKLFVTFRPTEDIKDEVSITSGHDYKSSTVTASSGKRKYSFFSQKSFAWLLDDQEEKGFIRKMFSGDSFKGEYRILVKEIDEKTCRVTIIAQGEEAKAYERELLSEINQSLS